MQPRVPKFGDDDYPRPRCSATWKEGNVVHVCVMSEGHTRPCECGCGKIEE